MAIDRWVWLLVVARAPSLDTTRQASKREVPRSRVSGPQQSLLASSYVDAASGIYMVGVSEVLVGLLGSLARGSRDASLHHVAAGTGEAYQSASASVQRLLCSRLSVRDEGSSTHLLGPLCAIRTAPSQNRTSSQSHPSPQACGGVAKTIRDWLSHALVPTGHSPSQLVTGHGKKR
ncbi:hypothetical protein FZEAL_2965 [Fusarium zealandicum]|uniref:Uncharacterized protein n=1 Tax=Fusarium zealandicum TaxID=1053134 RepID=A0A8H4UQF2_9HYPO|nr:hypothetical protein FZEAL_2965 [Fusarium zealandicum]